jgi:hypothetical protein
MNSEVVWVDSESTDTWFKKELRGFCGVKYDDCDRPGVQQNCK